MKNKKTLAVLGAGVVGTGLLIAYTAHMSAARSRSEAAHAPGVINPEADQEGLRTQPVPQISERTFKPAPSAITGSYTDPAAQEDPKEKGAGQNTATPNNSAR